MWTSKKLNKFVLPRQRQRNIFSKLFPSNSKILNEKKIGLFGIQNLFTTNDFLQQANESIQRCDKLRKKIYSLPVTVQNSSLILELLDQVSNEICSIIDPAELCRSTHSNEAFRKTANHVFQQLSVFINQLNSDKLIYQKLKEITQNKEICQQLTQEELIFSWDMLHEYENEGIHITNPQDRQEMIYLQNELVTLESEFLSNISDMESNLSSTSSTYPLGPLPDKEYQILSNWLSSQGVPQEYSSQQHDKYFESSQPSHSPRLNYIYLPFMKSIEQGVMGFISSSELRKKIYSMISSQPELNLPVLCRLILLRHKLSKIMGFSSYCERILSRKVLNNPVIVLSMLEQLTQTTNEQTKSELILLEDLKANPTSSLPIPPSSSSSPSSEKTAYPWDLPYLMGLHSQTQSHSSSSTSSSSTPRSQVEARNEFLKYCHLETCLNGIKLICKSLFDITMIREAHLSPTEIWTDHPDDIIKYTLYHNSSTDNNKESIPLGTIYLDPYSRDHKFGGASHFTIRCGCTNTSLNLEDSTATTATTTTRASQLPIVALIFNFPKDSNHKSIFLSLQQLENLYHEWGHALHSLLSRTKFQHLSGTRGSVEYVEVPSHLFEYFGRDPSIILQWARHYETKQPPSLNLVKEALSSQKYFTAIDLQTQVLVAAIDQEIYSSKPVEDLDLSSYPSEDPNKNIEIETTLSENISRIVLHSQQKYTTLPYGTIERTSPYSPRTISDILNIPSPTTSQPPSTVNQYQKMMILSNAHLLSHSHTITYGGTYYSYLFAKLHASQIWNILFKDDPLSRSSGMKIWNNMLQYGGSKSPNEILRDVGGGPLDPSHLMKEI